MSRQTIVSVRRLSKRFKIYDNSAARLADWFGLPPRRRYKEFWALHDVSFELTRGECLGIIGQNGAGKSTLLKLLTGVLTPTSGSLRVEGRVLSLLELGSDFNPELTGRQNVLESMRLLGLRFSNPADVVAEVEAFAELGEYFDRPVKMYSSGMFVRLAFSLFSTMNPEIFLVDEALTVGDLRFSAKAIARIRQMREQGTTLIFVSHNLEIVAQLCTRVMWVHGGRIQSDGTPNDVTSAYIQFMIGVAEPQPAPPSAERPSPTPAGNGLWLGTGWYPLEAHAGEVFRWADTVAEFVLAPSLHDRELMLEIEPASVTLTPQQTVVCVDTGLGLPGQYTVDSRTVLRIPVAPSPDAPQRLRVSLPDGPLRFAGDDRSLGFRVVRWGWSDTALESIQSVPVWRSEGEDPDLQYEMKASQRAMDTYTPVPDARAQFDHVVTRNARDLAATRFVTGDEVKLEITVKASSDVPKVIVGMEIKDAFGRGLYRTRNDVQSPSARSLAAGERTTLTFRCPKLMLGQGVYHFTLGVAGEGLENEVWQLVERAWSIQVLGASEMQPFGIVDLGWHYDPAAVDIR